MSIEQFNQHQQDTNSRVDSLAKAIFVLSGGALSISIGIFTNNRAIPELSQIVLKAAWYSLTISTISLVFMLFTIIRRDYLFGEQWRDQLDGKIECAKDNNPLTDSVIWIFALLGLFGFLFGYAGLAYVATSVLGRV